MRPCNTYFEQVGAVNMLLNLRCIVDVHSEKAEFYEISNITKGKQSHPKLVGFAYL